jgi:hypothetical protein
MHSDRLISGVGRQTLESTHNFLCPQGLGLHTAQEGRLLMVGTAMFIPHRHKPVQKQGANVQSFINQIGQLRALAGSASAVARSTVASRPGSLGHACSEGRLA